jgi:hypothetical protein
MSRRSIAVIVAVIAVATALWIGGNALWHALLVMHGRGR